MKLAYRIVSSRTREASHRKPFKRITPTFKTDLLGQRRKMVRDESGAFLKRPKSLPSGRRFSQSVSLLHDSAFTRASHLSSRPFFNPHTIAWLFTRLHLHGPLRLADLLLSSWVVLKGGQQTSRQANQGVREPITEKNSLPRRGSYRKRPWATATGTSELRERQAAAYLRRFDHKLAQAHDQPEFTLLKVVCNLRKYFGLSEAQTTTLVTALFNPKTEYQWSPEAISLAWDLVADYTPYLGLVDDVAVARDRALQLEDEVTELLARTRSGGETHTDDFFAALMAQNPDLNTTKTAVSIAVREVSGIKPKTYRNGRRFKGFHLPGPGEAEEISPAMVVAAAYLAAPLRPMKSGKERKAAAAIDLLFVDFRTFSRKRRLHWQAGLSQILPSMIHPFSSEQVLARERESITAYVRRTQDAKWGLG